MATRGSNLTRSRPWGVRRVRSYGCPVKSILTKFETITVILIVDNPTYLLSHAYFDGYLV